MTTQRRESYTMRLSPQERALLEQAAEREGVTMSAYVRAAALALAEVTRG